jgi:hypothetical protein
MAAARMLGQLSPAAFDEKRVNDVAVPAASCPRPQGIALRNLASDGHVMLSISVAAGAREKRYP